MICSKTFALTVDAPTCGAGTDWDNNPGACRVRIKNFVVGSIPGCPACPGGVGVEWDGTFPVFTAPSTYTIAAGTVIGGKDPLFIACNVNKFGGEWVVQLACDGLYIWTGRSLQGLSPVAVYSNTFGNCNPGLATVEIEAYTPP